MPGQIQHIIDAIVEERSHGNPVLASATRSKLLLKGIDPSRYTNMSPDDPEVMAKLKEIAKESGEVTI